MLEEGVEKFDRVELESVMNQMNRLSYAMEMRNEVLRNVMRFCSVTQNLTPHLHRVMRFCVM